jgi:hypothetical protein
MRLPRTVLAALRTADAIGHEMAKEFEGGPSISQPGWTILVPLTFGWLWR